MWGLGFRGLGFSFFFGFFTAEFFFCFGGFWGFEGLRVQRVPIVLESRVWHSGGTFGLGFESLPELPLKP